MLGAHLMQCHHYKCIRSKTTGQWITIPCGRCLACRVNKAAEWATRCRLECDYFKPEDCCFLTLTQDNDHVRRNEGVQTLCKKDLQDFIKRLRINGDRGYCKKLDVYFACGEYGSKRGRPHYHMLCYGYCPEDLVFLKSSYSGYPLYKSDSLARIWSRGLVFIGLGVNTASAGYVARYQTKKQSKKTRDKRQEPEFTLSSRRIPVIRDGEIIAHVAIGGRWLYENLNTALRGFLNDRENPNLKRRVPVYFEKLLKRLGFEDVLVQTKEYRKKQAEKLNPQAALKAATESAYHNADWEAYADCMERQFHAYQNEMASLYCDEIKLAQLERQFEME